MKNPPSATQAQTPNLRDIHLSPPGDFCRGGILPHSTRNRAAWGEWRLTSTPLPCVIISQKHLAQGLVLCRQLRCRKTITLYSVCPTDVEEALYVNKGAAQRRSVSGAESITVGRSRRRPRRSRAEDATAAPARLPGRKHPSHGALTIVLCFAATPERVMGKQASLRGCPKSGEGDPPRFLTPPPSPPLGDVGTLRPTPVTRGWRERFPRFLLSTRPRSCELQFCCPTYFLGEQRPHHRERRAVHGASPRDELTEGTRLTRQVCKKSRTFSPSAAFSHLLRSDADSSGPRASQGHFIGGEVRKENTVCARAPSFLIR